ALKAAMTSLAKSSLIFCVAALTVLSVSLGLAASLEASFAAPSAALPALCVDLVVASIAFCMSPSDLLALFKAVTKLLRLLLSISAIAAYPVEHHQRFHLPAIESPGGELRPVME